MPYCNRCTKRITNNTDDNNHGYCESCLILVARELVVNTPDFDYTIQDEAWRVRAKQTLIDLYVSLRESGMPSPIRGMTPSMRVLFWTLLKQDDFERIGIGTPI